MTNGRKRDLISERALRKGCFARRILMKTSAPTNDTDFIACNGRKLSKLHSCGMRARMYLWRKARTRGASLSLSILRNWNSLPAYNYDSAAALILLE